MSTDEKGTAEFSKIRSMIWPIHNYELKKFLPMGLMMLCILFIYTLVRDLKDTLVVSHAIGGGAETLGFLKLYCVVPSAILFMIVFVKLANKLSREKLFYSIVTFFLAFFVSFGFIIFPCREFLHMSAETISKLQASYPALHWFIPVIGNWSYSLFYIFAELWGSVVLTALFWQFANEITRVSEAKRFYSLFGFVGNFGLLASGSVIIACSNIAKKSANSGIDTFGTNLKLQIGSVLFFGTILLVIYRWMNKNVLTDKRYYDPGDIAKKKSKPKMGLGESAKMLFTNKYLLLIAVLVLAYGISINLVEGVFKGQIKLAYPDSNDYSKLMGKLSFTTGCLTIVVMLFGANILRLCSWKTAALITPVFLFCASLVFFGVIIYENNMGLNATIMGTSVVMIAVVTGLIQNAFSKGVKYSLFDSTMQMAYIPLSPEEKVKGQAAVSVLAGRMGKGGGAAIQSTMLMLAGGNTPLYKLVDWLAAIVFFVVLLWIFSVINLSGRFEKLTKEKEAEAKATTETK